MAESPILGLPQVAPGQAQKETIVNLAVIGMEGALNDSHIYDLTLADGSVQSRELTGYFLHTAVNNSVPRRLYFPPRQRVFALKNAGSSTLTALTTSLGANALILQPNDVWLIHSDGTTLTKISGVNTTPQTFTFTSLTDGPGTFAGQALKYARVNAAGTGLDFVTSASVVSGLSDFETEYTTTAPTAPATGVSLFTRKRAGLNRAAHISPTGRIDELQFALHQKTINFVQATGSGSMAGLGLVSTQSGTAAAGTMDFTSYVKSIRRMTLTPTSTAAGSVAFFAGAAHFIYRGQNSDFAGGFEYVCRFGIETYVAGQSFAVGIWNGATPVGSVNPSAQLDAYSGVLVYKDDTDTNLKLAYCDGGSPVQTVDLTATYPANTSATDFYELRLFCPAPGGDVYYSLHRLNTGNITEGHITTHLPSRLAVMNPVQWIGNMAITGAPKMSLASLYVATD